MSVLLQLAINGVLAASLYALISGGISFLYATTKIFHLAHGVVVIAGGYAFWWALTVFHAPAVVAALFALAVAAVLGILINELVYETLRRRGARGISYIIATLAVLVIGTAFILLTFGAAPKTFQFQTATHEFWGAYITTLQIWMFVISTTLLVFYFWITNKTKFGKAMRATADNEMVAGILGINTKQIRRYAFALSSVLASAAGILIGLEFNLEPNMGILLAVKGYAAAVIGGVGSFGGALLGALIIGFAEQAVVWYLGAEWRNASTFIILFLFLLLRPSGILGAKRDA